MLLNKSFVNYYYLYIIIINYINDSDFDLISFKMFLKMILAAVSYPLAVYI